MHHPRIHHLFLAGALVLLAAGVPLVARDLTVRYQRAEQFLPANVRRQVFNLEVHPHWIDGSSRFWYLSGSPKGKTFMYVDPATASRTPAFDHTRLARSLSTALQQPLNPAELPFDTIEFTDKGTAIEFTVDGDRWRCRLSDYTCTRKTEPASPPGLSPDGQWAAFVRDHNLWVTHRPTGQTIQLTFDGVKEDDYATPLPDPAEMVRQGTMDLHPEADVIWSPDSRYILTYRIDQRQAGHMYLVQSSPPDGGRPRLFSYTYPLPGERTLPLARIIICDVVQRKIRMVDAPPIPLCYYGNPWWGRWMEPDGTFRYLDRSRGYDTVTLREITLASGAVHTVFTEHADTYVDPNFWDLHFFHDSPEFLWTSERDGWNHLYLFDTRDGRLKNRVTQGEWVFRDLVHVDEKARQVYFLAGGREPGLDPYLRILYRVDLDGGRLVRLTPENMDHSVQFSPDGTWFLDTFSSVDTPPVTLLRRSADGATVMEVERADVSGLLAQGYRAPEAFRAKARDGKTDIYGVIYRPFDFDPARRYPVVDKIYTGPHNFFAPKTYWACASDANSIAQLGCIVIQVDGMGTGKRSRAFHEVSYKNLADGGLPDHIAAFRQLAERYPQLDLTRVGVYGFSAGGYDTVNALLSHPEFYKVGVAASGNHDHRFDKTWWNELWMGFPVGPNYTDQSNVTRASQLEGKLLLAHGEVDNNVNPTCTLKLVNALIQANKDFELLIVPNMFHYLDRSPYFVRRRWDFFVRNLLGLTPPPGYRIADTSTS